MKKSFILFLSFFFFLIPCSQAENNRFQKMAWQQARESVLYISGVYQKLNRFFERYPKLRDDYISLFGLDWIELKEISEKQEEYINKMIEDLQSTGGSGNWQRYVSLLPSLLGRMKPIAIRIVTDSNVSEREIEITNIRDFVVRDKRTGIYVINLSEEGNASIAVKIYERDKTSGQLILSHVFWLSSDDLKDYIWNEYKLLVDDRNLGHLLPDKISFDPIEVDYKLWGSFPLPEACPPYQQDEDSGIVSGLVTYKLRDGLEVNCSYDSRKRLKCESFDLDVHGQKMSHGICKYYDKQGRLSGYELRNFGRRIVNVRFSYRPDMELVFFEEKSDGDLYIPILMYEKDYNDAGIVKRIIGRELYSNNLVNGFEFSYRDSGSLYMEEYLFPDGSFVSKTFREDGSLSEEKYGAYAFNIDALLDKYATSETFFMQMS